MYSCSTCHCSFSRKQGYDYHIISKKHVMRSNENTSKYMFTCLECKKSFTQSSGLSKHKRICRGKDDHHEHISDYQDNQINEPEPQFESSIIAPPQIQSQLDTQNELIHSMQKEITSLTKRLDSNLREKRHKLPASIRNEIAERQLYHCGSCKNDLGAHYHIDHIVARQFGGDNCLENLMALCYECHVAKSVKETQRKTQIREAVQRILEDNE